MGANEEDKVVLLRNYIMGTQHKDSNNNITAKLVSLAIDKCQAIYPSISIFIVLFNKLKVASISQKLKFKDLRIREITENYASSKEICELEQKKGGFTNKVNLDNGIAITLEAVMEDLELCKKL